jgi:sec-independent protein translocase protein TatC
VVAAFAMAAVLTPPVVVSQLLLAVPLIGLYFIALVGIKITRRRRDSEAETEAA